MKKLLISGVLLFALGANAQTNIYNTSGTLTGNRVLTLGSYSLHFKPTLSLSNGLFINSTGNVGIGTTTPTHKLQVSGNIKGNAGIFTKSMPLNPDIAVFFANNNERVNASLVLAAGTRFTTDTESACLHFFDFPKSNMDATPTVWFGIDDRANMTRFRMRASQGGGQQFFMYDKTQTEFFKITEDGAGNAFMAMTRPSSYLSIGTSSMTDGGENYKLSVAGKIRAHEVKVYTTWADYVFEDDYKLKTLEEVEQYINENGHLPNVPSAATIEKKGLEVGNMIKIQQEKIEELTLYLIEQEKENDQLKKDVEELKAAVKVLMEKQ